MFTLIATIVGAILGLAIHVGIVYYLVKSTADNEKSPALAAILSLIVGPIIGFAYARPEAWGSGVVAEVFFAAPLAGAMGALATSGNVVVSALIGVYLAVAIVVTAVLMAQDQNEHVELKKAQSE